MTTDVDDLVPQRFRGGKGSPMLLLHGLGMSWRAWRPLLAGLAESHDLLAPTLPGHRGGPRLDGDCTVESLADAVEAEMAAAGFSAAHVVGNSLGGWIALELARRGRARSVTAISPAGAWRTPRDLLRLHLAVGGGGLLLRNPVVHHAAGLSVHQPRVRRMAFMTLMERGDRMTTQEAKDMLRDFRECSVIGEAVRMGRAHGRLQRLQPAGYPVQMIWGRRDKVIPYHAYGAPMVDRVGSLTRIGLAGAGHVPMYDATTILRALIVQLTGHADLLRLRGAP